MTKELKESLIKEYKRIFINVYEAGGGYGFRYFHGVRTMTYCERILKLDFFKNKKINKDAVIIAALFADVGKIEAVDKNGELVYKSPANENHDKIGAKIVTKYLSKHIEDKKLLDLIVEIISEQHVTQTSLESKIVKDVDRLDNYGYIQIWRHITHANHDKRNIDRIKEFWIDGGEKQRAKKYLNKFNFPVIGKISNERYKKLDNLILEIDRESKGFDIK